MCVRLIHFFFCYLLRLGCLNAHFIYFYFVILRTFIYFYSSFCAILSTVWWPWCSRLHALFSHFAYQLLKGITFLLLFSMVFREKPQTRIYKSTYSRRTIICSGCKVAVISIIQNIMQFLFLFSSNILNIFYNNHKKVRNSKQMSLRG